MSILHNIDADAVAAGLIEALTKGARRDARNGDREASSFLRDLRRTAQASLQKRGQEPPRTHLDRLVEHFDDVADRLRAAGTAQERRTLAKQLQNSWSDIEDALPSPRRLGAYPDRARQHHGLAKAIGTYRAAAALGATDGTPDTIRRIRKVAAVALNATSVSDPTYRPAGQPWEPPRREASQDDVAALLKVPTQALDILMGVGDALALDQPTANALMALGLIDRVTLPGAASEQYERTPHGWKVCELLTAGEHAEIIRTLTQPKPLIAGIAQ